MQSPIWKQLEEYRRKERISFAMPGHKGGAGICEEFKQNFFAYDVTEVEDIDGLHEPKAAVLEAQKQAAEFFGAERTFFLVNGSTSGIFAMLLASCSAGDSILVNRACHQSVVHACVVMGLNPIFLEQETIPEFGIPDGIHPDAVEELLKKHKVSAVLVTSPSYYGIVSDIRSIAEVAHRYRVPLLVDEAHGAHYAVSEELFPQSAIRLGADLVVQSAHKTLNAMNQTALLHLRTELVETERVIQSCKMLQTSSPSYAMLATMDEARADLEENGANDWNRVAEACERMRRELAGVVRFLKKESGRYIYDMDVCRVVFNLSDYAMSGYDMAERLQNAYNIDVEMADLYNVVLIPTPANRETDIPAITEAVRDILKDEPKNKQETMKAFPKLPEAVLTPQAAFYKKGVGCVGAEAIGKLSKNAIVIYPPGVALVAPGERIGKEQIEYLLHASACGAQVTGLQDGKFCVIEDV